MAVQRVRVGDIGTIIRLRVLDESGVVDISTSTVRRIILTAPDHTARTLTATLTSSGTDGRLQYTTVANDINQIGNWEARAQIEFTSSQHFTSDPLHFIAGPAQ